MALGEVRGAVAPGSDPCAGEGTLRAAVGAGATPRTPVSCFPLHPKVDPSGRTIPKQGEFPGGRGGDGGKGDTEFLEWKEHGSVLFSFASGKEQGPRADSRLFANRQH